MRPVEAAILLFLAGALGGCSYRPLDAPCAMNDAGGPSMLPGRDEAPAASGGASVQTLYFAEPETERPVSSGPFAAMPKSDDCGPLRPINSGALR